MAPKECVAMKCPKCQSPDICRSQRKGIFDNLRSSMGWWPYRCGRCNRRFVALRRYPPAPEQRRPEAQNTSAKAGPEMAFRKKEDRPTAQVVIQADDHVQLDRILLALHSAVTSYQPGGARETAGRR